MSHTEPPAPEDEPGLGAYIVIAAFALLLLLFVVIVVQTGNTRFWETWNPHNNL